MPEVVKITPSASIRQTCDWVFAEYERLASENSRLELLVAESRRRQESCKPLYNDLQEQDLDDETKTVPHELWKPAPPKLAFACVLPSTSIEEIDDLEDHFSDSGQNGCTEVVDEIPRGIAMDYAGAGMATWKQKKSLRSEDSAQESKPHGRRSVPRAIFNDMNDVKNLVKQHLVMKPSYRVEDFYKVKGIFQQVARSKTFENCTLVLILVNALWIAVDADHNSAEQLFDADLAFIVAEQFFCLVFTVELVIRFLAFANKRNCLRDMWFVFDLCLVVMMVLETWVLAPALHLNSNDKGGSGMGNASVLKLAKMLRLCRMFRVARLMRSMPEFFILIKAIASSARATFFTLAFLAVILYVYGIVFKQLLEGTSVGKQFFDTVPAAMETLFFQVAIADDIIAVVEGVREENMLAHVLLYTVTLVGHITLMNMLIGVLCEGISLVAERERMAIQVAMVESTLREILLDEGDDDDVITKDEFLAVLQSRKAVLGLEDIGIDVVSLVDAADGIFQSNDEQGDHFGRTLTFEEFMEVLLQLRGSNRATVKDIVDLRKYIHKVIRNLEKLRKETSQNADSVVKIQSELKTKVASIGSSMNLNQGEYSP